MGCSNAKVSALQELEQIIRQITLENDKLEKERDKLKSQHDDRPEEEKDSLQDLRLMHTDLEKEIKELKDIMTEFMPIPEQKDHTYFLIKSSIDRITQLQLELEDQSDQLEEMVSKRNAIKDEHESLQNIIFHTEREILELESLISKQDKAIHDKLYTEESKGLAMLERQRTFVGEEIRIEDTSFRNIYEECKITELDENSNSSEKSSSDSVAALSEVEITKELRDVESELRDLDSQIKSLDLSEIEMHQMNNYVSSLNNKLATTAKNSSIKQQITESQVKIDALRLEKKMLKQEVMSLKKCTHDGKSEGTNKKIQALNEILQQKRISQETMNSKTLNEKLVTDVEETLKKARELSISMKRK